MKLSVLDELGISYVLKPSKAQSSNKLRIAVSFIRSGKLSIRYSRGIKADEIAQFIVKNLEWIKKAHQKQMQPQRNYVKGETYLYLGKPYEVLPYVSRHEAVIISENTMHIYAKTDNPLNRAQVVEKWKLKQCEMVFQELLYQGFSLLKNQIKQYPQLQIKAYKSRWGCCYPTKNLIILNSSLIHVPIDLIQYVVMHELVHLLFPDHSAQFHQLLASFIPDERIKRRQIAQYRPDYQ